MLPSSTRQASVLLVIQSVCVYVSASVCVCVSAYVSCPDFMFSLSFGNYDLNGSPACGVSFCVSFPPLPSLYPSLCACLLCGN